MRFRVCLFAAAFIAPGLAFAQVPGTGAAPPRVGISAEDRLRQDRLDRLYESLRDAADPEDAARFEKTIEELWARSGSDTADLLNQRAGQLVAADASADAVRLLDAVLSAAPDFADGFNRRATLHFLAGDQISAMRDIRQALRYEPRHYAAWTGLGRILDQSGDGPRALEAYRRALAINPNLTAVRTRADALSRETRGQEL